MTANHCHEGQHIAACIERSLDQIRENNKGTALTDPESELTLETETEAAEWLANGNATCWTAGDCNCTVTESEIYNCGPEPKEDWRNSQEYADLKARNAANRPAMLQWLKEERARRAPYEAWERAWRNASIIGTES